MLVLFDNGTPRSLARYLIDCHAVTEARARGWEQLGNGELLTAAEEVMEQFEVTREQIQAVLEFAARSLDAPPIPTGAAALRPPNLNDKGVSRSTNNQEQRTYLTP